MAASGVVCRSKVLLLVDFNRVINLSYFIGASPCNQGSWTKRPRSCRRLHTGRCRLSFQGGDHPLKTASLSSSTSASAAEDLRTGEVNIEYFRGLPQVTVPLPSRKERCRFTLRPISNTVGDFLMMLRHEDHGIDRASITSLDGVRIASSNTIEALMEQDFKLIVNDNVYLVTTPKQERLSQEELRQMSDVRNLVSQLYEALNVDEHQLKKERELLTDLEDVRLELKPLEEKYSELDMAARRKTNALTWFGLTLMSVQFGILARLTWWEYSWDIMEPVTYFVTYGTAMAAYAYFVLTKQEYLLPDVKDRQHLMTFHKRARKVGLNLERYNSLKDTADKIENDLKRLRDPLQLHLPSRNTDISAERTHSSPLEQVIKFLRSNKRTPSKES